MTKKISEFKLGSDPELFLKMSSTGLPFPAIDVVKGTKDKPQKMKGLPKGFTWQVDNMSLEYNTPPASTKEEWVRFQKMALRYIKLNIPLGLSMHIVPSVIFDEEYMKMPGAEVMGCSSTLNCWTRKTNPKPKAENRCLRSAGFHIHVGFPEGKDQLLSEKLMRTMDLFLGVSSILIDEDERRRELYGKAGEFRFAKSFHGREN